MLKHVLPALTRIRQLHGDDVLFNPEKLRAFLLDMLHGDYVGEIEILVKLLSMGMVHKLRGNGKTPANKLAEYASYVSKQLYIHKAQIAKGLRCWNQVLYDVEPWDDKRKEFEILLEKAKSGDAGSQNDVGYRLDQGIGIEKNYDEAFKWFMKSAKQGNKWGESNVALYYRYGKSVKQDYKKAFYWYKKAAKQGYCTAQFQIAWLYDSGYGVEQNFASALYWYKKAADQGYAYAQNNIGYMYDWGRGVKQDFYIAREWYEKAEKQNNLNAQYNLGYMYEFGRGVKQDYEKAFIYYKKSADNGDTIAKYRIALLLSLGKGCSYDYISAFDYMQEAAKEGYEEAKEMLGDYLDKNEPLAWYVSLAEKGDMRVQYNLGLLYAKGEGGNSSICLAIKWMQESAAQDFTEAIIWLLEAYQKSKLEEVIDEFAANLGYLDDLYTTDYFNISNIYEFEKMWNENKNFENEI